MPELLILFRPWRGGCRHLVPEDCLAGFCLLLLLVIVGLQSSLLFDTPCSFMALLCMVFTCYLLHSKVRWPRAPSPRAILAVLAFVLAAAMTFIPGPKVNAWLTALIGLACLNVYRYLLELVWREFRGTFTPGEVLILTQAATFIIFSVTTDVMKYTGVLRYHDSLFPLHNNSVPVTAFSKAAGVSALLVFVSTVLSPSCFLRNLAFSLALGLCHVTITMRANPVLWFVGFLLEPGRLQLIAFWFCALFSCLPVLFYYRSHVSDDVITSDDDVTPEPRAPGTVSRKFFHVVVVAIFIPGLLMDVPLLYVASALALAGLLVLETLRLLNIPPLGGVVEALFSSFRDRQDRGKLLLTPMYLLVACSLPVWLFGAEIRQGEDPPLILFLGVMTVAVGDGAAAVFGSLYGKHTLMLGSGKSLAGFMACVMSQMVFGWFLIHKGISGEYRVLPAVIFVSSVTELCTSHVDNLVLPIYSLLTYCVVDFSLRVVLEVLSNLLPGLVVLLPG